MTAKIMVPSSCIDVLVAENAMEEIAVATAPRNHYGWASGVSTEEQWNLLFSALPEGPQKHALQRQRSKRKHAAEGENNEPQ